MNDVLKIDDANLISSKRASELSGYAQDYIGQLARKGLIQGKRIGGLWYVSLESLEGYKANGESSSLDKPRPNGAPNTANDLDSVISFDGKDYVSASRAAKITGYHQDYVGQLARSGKILSRQIGNRWYVDRDKILGHKREKDALLGAVQSESVGVSAMRAEKDEPREPSERSEPFFTYSNEVDDLMPKLKAQETSSSRDQYTSQDGLSEQPIAIRRVISSQTEPVQRASRHHNFEVPKQKDVRSRHPMKILVPAALTVVVVLSLGFVTLKRASVYAYFKGEAASGAAKQVASVGGHSTGVLQSVADMFERLFGTELKYTKSR